MIPEAREVHLSKKDHKVLEACCRSPVTLQRDLKRARIVLLAASGRSARSIAKEAVGEGRRVGVRPQASREISQVEVVRSPLGISAGRNFTLPVSSWRGRMGGRSKSRTIQGRHEYGSISF